MSKVLLFMNIFICYIVLFFVCFGLFFWIKPYLGMEVLCRSCPDSGILFILRPLTWSSDALS